MKEGRRRNGEPDEKRWGMRLTKIRRQYLKENTIINEAGIQFSATCLTSL